MTSFHWSDYLVFTAAILTSVGIGIYYAVARGGQKTTEKYLMGNRKMKFFPVTISLAVTSLSAVTIQGVPGEVYLFGLKFLFYFLGVFSASVICAYTFVPLYYPLKITSVNEYLELRFKSKSVRLLGCIFLVFMQCCYVGCLMFGPAIALQIATGINPMYTLLFTNTAGILYTTIGGINAVVYTDLFQFFIMFFGVVAVAILGCIKAGGIGNVIAENQEWGRLDFSGYFDPSPHARVTLWSNTFGSVFLFTALYGVNQASTQRCLAMPKLEQAQKSLFITGAIFVLMHSLSCVVGVSMFGYYSQAGCDPLTSGQLNNPNQLLPEFVIAVINYPTLPGLFISALVSSSLSSLSSSINSMSAVLWEDLLKRKLSHMTESRKTTLTRILSLVFGLICTAISFAVWTVGGNLSQVAIATIGALIGPLLGVHILGALFPWANWIGALVGGISAFLISFVMLLGQILSKEANIPLPLPTHGCKNGNGTFIHSFNESTYEQTLNTSTQTMYHNDNAGSSFAQFLFTISFHWYSLMCVMLTLSIGMIVSFLTGFTNPDEVEPRFLFTFIRKYFHKTSKFTNYNDLAPVKVITGERNDNKT